MEIWLDTIDLGVIQDASKMGILYGVTTNPSILAKVKDVRSTLSSILDLQPGPLAVQVLGQSGDDMFEEAKVLAAFSDRIIVKVPVNAQGIQVIRRLNREGIPTLGTAIFHPKQALLAIQAKADYIAPYLSQIEKQGVDSLLTCQLIQEIIDAQKSSTKVLGCVRELDQLIQCAKMGLAAATIKPTVYQQLISEERASEEAVKTMRQEWELSQAGTLVEALI